MKYHGLEMARRSDHTREELRNLILESARRIVQSDGIETLTARKIAAGTGYTVGTIYQHFEGMDDLVHQLNGGTLQSLYEHCAGLNLIGSPGENLTTLANSFVEFAEARGNEWEAVISYRYGPDHEWSEDYDATVSNLLGLMGRATASLYSSDKKAQQIKDMRLLWVSLYGAFTLNSAGRLGKEQTLPEIIDSLVEMFLSSKR